MAAATTAITALAGLGLSAKQLYDREQKRKNADKSAQIAQNRLEEISQENKLAALQVPDISKLAFERNERAKADALKAIGEMGPEGAAMATKIEQSTRESNLAAAEKQGNINYQRDLTVLSQDQAIEDDRVAREEGIAWGQLQGAQAASAEARAGKRAATENIVGSLGNTISGLGEATSLEAKANRGARKKRRSSGTGSVEPSNMDINDVDVDWDMLEGSMPSSLKYL